MKLPETVRTYWKKKQSGEDEEQVFLISHF
jgi:hypothetical protein